ncbi:MAG: hypothetical protein IPJ13_30555 [Saprospiraceae bacterium]|nr:hypothetical protein [Saprospiraceae bacterium]
MNYEGIIAQKDAGIAQKDIEIQQEMKYRYQWGIDDGNDGVNIQVLFLIIQMF